jgi:hypothetical protein
MNGTHSSRQNGPEPLKRPTYRFGVSGLHFIFPSQCACCGQIADATLKVSSTEYRGRKGRERATRTFDVPYCYPCLERTRRGPDTNIPAVLAAVVGIILGLALLNQAAWLGVLFIAAGLLAAFALQHRSTAAQRLPPSCFCPRKSVALRGWHGTRYEFEMLSREYATAFMAANLKKLIDVRDEARQLLDSMTEAQPGQPQSPRRYSR